MTVIILNTSYTNNINCRESVALTIFYISPKVINCRERQSDLSCIMFCSLINLVKKLLLETNEWKIDFTSKNKYYSKKKPYIFRGSSKEIKEIKKLINLRNSLCILRIIRWVWFFLLRALCYILFYVSFDLTRMLFYFLLGFYWAFWVCTNRNMICITIIFVINKWFNWLVGWSVSLSVCLSLIQSVSQSFNQLISEWIDWFILLSIICCVAWLVSLICSTELDLFIIKQVWHYIM